MINVKGKWALITGASRGLGYLTAKVMAQQGCNLVLHSRRLENNKKVLEEVKALGVEAYSVAAEFSKLEDIETMLKEIDDNGTQIDIVINNAAIQIAYRKDYFSTPISDFQESFVVNTIAQAMICYHYLPKMIKRGFGRVVNTTSGIRLEPEQAGYSASKAALDKITIDIGSKLEGTDVMINLTDPGWCRTDLGGPNATNSPESAIPGIVIGAFINDKKSGRLICAQDFSGMSLEDAVAKVEAELDSPYGKC